MPNRSGLCVGKMKLSPKSAKLLDSHRIEPFDGPLRRQFRSSMELHVPKSLECESFSRHPKGFLMSLGAFSYVSAATRDTIKMKVGRYCSIARGVNVVAGNHPIEAVTTNPFFFGNYHKEHFPEVVNENEQPNFKRNLGNVHISHDVWIGGHCILKAGIKIGTGAVVAAGSVVVKDVAPYTIVGGNPASVIRLRFSEEIASRLLNSHWWEIDPKILRTITMTNIPVFCDQVEELRSADQLTIFNPKKFKLDRNEIEIID
jgi:virginiamycin A acetyltransferase